MQAFLLAVLAAAVGALGWAMIRLRSLRAAAEDETARRRVAEKEAATAGRLAAQAEQERDALAEVLREFPRLARELHTGIAERQIPSILLKILDRALAPRAAAVFVRRHKAMSEEGRDAQLLLAAASPADFPLRRGAAVRMGQGEIGFVAEVQRAMARADFEAQTATTRNRIHQEGVPGFEVDAAAPMVFDGETVGVLAISRPERAGGEAMSVLRLIAQMGALAIHNVAAYTELKVTADVDGLTLVFNKQHMSRVLPEAIVKAQRALQSVSIFLFDLDHFKNYNDLNGHVAGDQLLQLLARVVKENTRRDNVFGRFGGEEFLLIMPGVSAARAIIVAESVRERIARYRFPFGDRQPLGHVSVSGGVAEFPSDALDGTRLLRAADAALYEAKRAGRDRVCPAPREYLGREGPEVPVEAADERAADPRAAHTEDGHSK